MGLFLGLSGTRLIGSFAGLYMRDWVGEFAKWFHLVWLKKLGKPTQVKMVVMWGSKMVKNLPKLNFRGWVMFSRVKETRAQTVTIF